MIEPIPPRPPRSLPPIADDLPPAPILIPYTMSDSAKALSADLSDLAASDAAAVPGVIRDVLGAVWEAVEPYTPDALRAVADGVQALTASRPPAVRFIGGLAARLLRLAADRL